MIFFITKRHPLFYSNYKWFLFESAYPSAKRFISRCSNFFIISNKWNIIWINKCVLELFREGYLHLRKLACIWNNSAWDSRGNLGLSKTWNSAVNSWGFQSPGAPCPLVQRTLRGIYIDGVKVKVCEFLVASVGVNIGVGVSEHEDSQIH